MFNLKGLGKWASAIAQSVRLKTRKKKPSSQRMSLLPIKGLVSVPGESAAVRFVQPSLVDFGDKVKVSDNDPAVVRTVENLSVIGSDTPTRIQEEEVRTVGGIPSR